MHRAPPDRARSAAPLLATLVALAGVAGLTAGCFDSLVGGACVAGFDRAGSRCVPRTTMGDAGPGPEQPDAGPVADAAPRPDGARPDAPPPDAAPPDAPLPDAPPVDAPPDALVCTAPEAVCAGQCVNVDSDPSHCGACGHACASGICSAGVCQGTLSGHIVAIGHDYRLYNRAMTRLLGNSIALGSRPVLRVARYRGTSAQPAAAGTAAAMAAGLAQLGRAWQHVPLPAAPSPTALDGIDVLVIEAQGGSGDAAHAAGAAWASVLDLLLQRGGVVVVLEGTAGVSYRFAEGANLFTVAGTADATGLEATLAIPADAIGQQVVSPYLAVSLSAAFVGGPPAVIAAPAGTIAFHATRY